MQVDCAPPGDIVIDVNTFRSSSGGYIRLALESVAGDGGLESVELREASEDGNAPWTSLKNKWGANWEGSGLTSTPFDIQITSSSGEVITDL